MQTCPWRVNNYYIWHAMFCKKIIVANINYISCIKLCIGNIIQRCIFFCIFNGIIQSLPHQLFFLPATYKNANAAGAAIQIIHNFIARQFCKISCNTDKAFLPVLYWFEKMISG